MGRQTRGAAGRVRDRVEQVEHVGRDLSDRNRGQPVEQRDGAIGVNLVDFA